MKSAQAELKRAIVDQKIALYLLETGDACSGVLQGLAATVALVQLACEIDKLRSPDLLALHHCLKAFYETIELGHYDTQYTAALVLGLDAAQRLASRVKPKSIDKAVQRMFSPSL